MRDNADFKYLVELGNQLLKEGVLGRLNVETYLEHFNTAEIAKLPRPPGATGFVTGDSIGGNGWVIQLADGTEQMYYIDLPTAWKVETTTHFADVISELGLSPPEEPIDRLLHDYLSYLQRLLGEAQREFSHT